MIDRDTFDANRLFGAAFPGGDADQGRSDPKAFREEGSDGVVRAAVDGRCGDVHLQAVTERADDAIPAGAGADGEQDLNAAGH